MTTMDGIKYLTIVELNIKIILRASSQLEMGITDILIMLTLSLNSLLR